VRVGMRGHAWRIAIRGAMIENSTETAHLLQAAAGGDHGNWGALLQRHRERLHRMVVLRLDYRLQGRIGTSDVIREAYLEASRRMADYLKQPTMPFFLWLR